MSIKESNFQFLVHTVYEGKEYNRHYTRINYKVCFIVKQYLHC